jgi:SET domain
MLSITLNFILTSALILSKHCQFISAEVQSEDVVTGSFVVDESKLCGVYLGESVIDPTRLALYVNKEYDVEQPITDQDLVVPVINANRNEYSPWQDFMWGESFIPLEVLHSTTNDTATTNKTIYQQQIIRTEYFIAGIAAIAPCTSTPNNNAQSNQEKMLYGNQYYNNENDRISDYRNFTIEATTQLSPGQMIVNDCQYDPAVPESSHEMFYPNVLSLANDGVCMDTIQIRESTIPNIGRGAFTKQYFAAGDIVASTPVIHFDRSQTDIVQQSLKEVHRIPHFRDHGIEYTGKVIGQQLLLNYCYGHPNSNVLLLPYGPGVNFINHHTTKANVQIRWLTKFGESELYRSGTISVMEMYELPATSTKLMIEFVAIQDILPGDEIFYNYGPEFIHEWENYISNVERKNPFRHEIGVPNYDFYPKAWMRDDVNPYGDFIASPLGPGHMAPVRWLGTAEVVTPWAFRIGLHSRVRKVLLQYCNKMGITDILRHVTTNGNELEPGTESYMKIEGDDWYIQRPEANWRSNLHWFSPGAGPAHEHYLQALSYAGFDRILSSIGEYLGMDGLVAFHVTFIGVSYSNRGFLHHDVRETGAKVYNIIIPLLLANDTGPELDLQGWNPGLPDTQEYPVGRYRYEYDVASMMGDSAIHATSACDYRYSKEMRMAATVYVADVNEINADNIMNHYTQAYPPSDIDLLKSWIGRHWKRNNPTRKLPKPSRHHILLRNNIWTASPRSGVVLDESRIFPISNSNHVQEEEL